MKSVHVGFSHRPDDIRIFQKESISLAKNGYEVTYVTSNRNADVSDGKYAGVEVVVISLMKANRAKRFLRYCKDLKKQLILLDADVYHFHEMILLPVMAVMHRKGKLVIYDMHEDTPRQMQPMLKRKYGIILGNLITMLIERYENQWIKHADYVIAATPHIEERCKQHTSRVSVVANYPILQNPRGLLKSFRNRRKAICYTGGISELNGIHNIAMAMEKVHGELYLAGTLDNRLKEQIQDYPGWKRVHALGYVSREDVQKLFRETMAGLVLYLPSGNTMAAMPNKIFEYMEAGIPVIASDFTLWKSIVEDTNSGMCVDPTNPSEIARAINHILENPELAEEMGKNGRTSVEERYNWGTEEKELLRIYQKEISGYDKNR